MLIDDLDGDLVYIMDLAPMYAITGGRTGMLGKRLPDVCATLFDRLVSGKEGRARMKGDYFMMSFVTLSRDAALRRSAESALRPSVNGSRPSKSPACLSPPIRRTCPVPMARSTRKR
ncbi:MAG: hypothetical protein VW268_10540 [Rhodospirillaceae bacterium]